VCAKCARKGSLSDMPRRMSGGVEVGKGSVGEGRSGSGQITMVLKENEGGNRRSSERLRARAGRRKVGAVGRCREEAKRR
jgi:hypothetical protein